MRTILTPQQHAILQRERDILSALEAIAAQLDAPTEEREILTRTRAQLDAFFLLVVVGEFNSGKSAFVNALLGERFLDEGVTPTTSQIYTIVYGEQPKAEQIEPFVLRVHYPVDWLREINIVDTPGTNAIIQRHQEITESFIPRADMVLFVTSVDRPFSESERLFLQLVRGWGKKVVVVLNKIDILESEAELEEIIAFVREQAAAVLGTVPLIFPVSIKWAQQARFDANGERAETLMARSRFAELENYILRTLDEQQRLVLKLESPLGVVERLHQAYQAQVSARLKLLEEDFDTIEHVEAQLDAYANDMRHDFRFRMAKIDNILHQVRERGDEFFEEMVRLSRFFDLLNRARIQSEFEIKVIADAPQAIEREVDELIDWMVERNYRQWQEITDYLNRRAAQHRDRIIGKIGGDFEINRRQLLDSVGRAAREVVATYDQRAEARKQSEAIQTALAAMGAVEVSAVGLGAVLLAVLSRALDPLGVLAAGAVAIAGLFILPARRRAAKKTLESNILALRKQLDKALSATFEQELEQSIQDIREAISPYTRFVRVERERLLDIDAQLQTIATQLRQTRSEIHALRERNA
ncbi:MAG: GTP-binding protein [Chloroflexi bacterium]|nr:GTP-binding protein [Chloroflexota bacterium]